MIIRVMISTRERLEYTIKCIQALERFTKNDLEIFLFDDRSKENLAERFQYYKYLVENNKIAHLEILPSDSKISFNTFGKAVSWNIFGYISSFMFPEQYFDWILLIDNDIIVRKEGWDTKLIETWRRINQYKELKTIQVVTQAPGGIMGEKLEFDLEDGYKIRVGSAGGSGFWFLKKDYFKNMGLLPLKFLIGKSKGHDQLSWQLHQLRTNSRRYVAGLWDKLALHIGHNRSICNYLTWGREKKTAPGDKIRADRIKEAIEKEENKLKQISLDEVIKKYDKREYQRW